MALGKKRLPDNIKLVKGTFKKCRGTVNDKHSQDVMTPPVWLPESCHGHFGTIQGLLKDIGLDSKSYADVVAMAAMRIQEIDECSECVASLGRVVEALTGGYRANPAVGQRSEAMRHLQSLLAEFGLTPSSIGRVGGKKAEPDKTKGFGGL